MRLATFNIQHGLGPDGRVDNNRLADAVAALDADVVGLQEVDLRQARSGGVDQARLCAEAMGAVDHRFRPALAGPFRYPGVRRRARSTERPEAPGYGIALLSRFPVRAGTPSSCHPRRRGSGAGSSSAPTSRAWRSRLRSRRPQGC
ncbi:endonuclease/exonuclease/phosphatase family protein [Promicromonospora soli]